MYTRFLSTAFLGVAISLNAAMPLHAQSLAPALQLTLDDALRLAAESDPRLQGQRFVTQGAAARRAQAALKPAITVSAEVENVLGTGQLSAFDDLEATLSLGTTLELGDKRVQRMAVADREAERLEMELQAERLDVFAGVAKRFIAVLRAQENVAVARDDKALDARIQSIVTARVQSAAAAPVERSNAEVTAIQADLAEQSAVAELRESWGHLVVTWGGAPDSSGRVAGDLFATPPMPAFSSLDEMVNRNPDILRFAAERRVRQAALSLAQSQSEPDIEVAAGVRRLQASRAQAVVLSASVPLGASGRSQPLADEARSRLSQVDMDERARRQEVLGLLHGLRQRAANAAAALAKIQTGALPAAQRAQEQAEAAFRTGRSSLLELTATQHQLLDLRRAKIDAASSYHLAVIDIERLIGTPLAAAGPSSLSSSGAP
jgi:outer membrane protein, heavy metal efflux system